MESALLDTIVTSCERSSLCLFSKASNHPSISDSRYSSKCHEPEITLCFLGRFLSVFGEAFSQKGSFMGFWLLSSSIKLTGRHGLIICHSYPAILVAYTTESGEIETIPSSHIERTHASDRCHCKVIEGTMGHGADKHGLIIFLSVHALVNTVVSSRW